MIADKNIFLDMLNSPIRTIRGRVEIYSGSTLATICGCHNNLQNFTIERIGEDNKFFGYGVCQKLKVNLLDRERTLNLTKDNTLEVEFGVGSDYIYPCPLFYIHDIKRNENTNVLTIEAYDALYRASAHTVAELEIKAPYSIRDFARACASLLGIPMKEVTDSSFYTEYPEGANFEGTETIREALNAVAEATQTIYYIDKDWELTFKKLGGNSVLTIDKSKYFSLENKGESILTGIVSATELGDNVGASMGEGATQYVRDNPFWELREDIDSLVDNALANIGGLAINQFNCKWRGNFLLEIGDKIDLVTKDNNLISSYVLNDTISFDGSLAGQTDWSYKDQAAETASNPTNLGEVLKQTFARVDKQNKEIQMLASESDKNTQEIAELRISTQNINASVSRVTQSVDDLNNNVGVLTERVNTQLTPEAVTIQIQNELEKSSIDKVTTTTGFTFNEQGLNVSKSGSEISTTITEDGMAVAKSGKDVLTANNEGVTAIDLHAETYLIIAGRSRLENYGDRTACFWIGGSF